jgi:hypothetical protein
MTQTLNNQITNIQKPPGTKDSLNPTRPLKVIPKSKIIMNHELSIAKEMQSSSFSPVKISNKESFNFQPSHPGY